MTSLDTTFGPPSDPILVSEFIDNARSCHLSLWSTSAENISGDCRNQWLALPDSQKEAIEAECSVDDFRVSLNEIIENPRLMAYATKSHETIVHDIHETADSSSRRKRKRNVIPDTVNDHPETASLQEKLASVKLTSWPLSMSAALFIRPPKQSDHNTLVLPKCFATPEPDTSARQALVFVTVYNPVSWGHRLLARASQHVLLSTQSLADLYDAIPCTSHEIPCETVDEDGRSTWQHNSQPVNTGAVMCIEGRLYGDGQSERDYADKYVEYAKALPEKKRPVVSKAGPMHDAVLSSITVRLHTPNWILHSGDCTHHIVFEQIRLLHPSDPPVSAYPLTTQITPPLLDLCRACNKVPAVLSITGDVRLGESPFMICQPCWRWMGRPAADEAYKISVFPLPTHEFGWH